jgi:hypothetical protein
MTSLVSRFAVASSGVMRKMGYVTCVCVCRESLYLGGCVVCVYAVFLVAFFDYVSIIFTFFLTKTLLYYIIPELP